MTLPGRYARDDDGYLGGPLGHPDPVLVAPVAAVERVGVLEARVATLETENALLREVMVAAQMYFADRVIDATRRGVVIRWTQADGELAAAVAEVFAHRAELGDDG